MKKYNLKKTINLNKEKDLFLEKIESQERKLFLKKKFFNLFN